MRTWHCLQPRTSNHPHGTLAAALSVAPADAFTLAAYGMAGKVRCGTQQFELPTGSNTFLEVHAISNVSASGGAVTFTPHQLYHRSLANATLLQQQCMHHLHATSAGSAASRASCNCMDDPVTVGWPAADGQVLWHVSRDDTANSGELPTL